MGESLPSKIITDSSSKRMFRSYCRSEISISTYVIIHYSLYLDILIQLVCTYLYGCKPNMCKKPQTNKVNKRRLYMVFISIINIFVFICKFLMKYIWWSNQISSLLKIIYQTILPNIHKIELVQVSCVLDKRSYLNTTNLIFSSSV